MIEGEGHVIWSMVVAAVYQMQKQCVDVRDCDDASHSFVQLWTVFMNDFDECCNLTSDDGKVKHYHAAVTSFHNLYVGVHYCLFLPPS